MDIVKLRDYSLSPEHRDGKHKARVFEAALGLTRQNAEWLKVRLLEVAKDEECQLGLKTESGQRYLIDFPASHEGRSARLRSVWIVRTGETSPRLVTCYVL